MRLKIFLVSLILLLLAACTDTTETPGTTQVVVESPEILPTLPQGILIQVMKPDGSVVGVTVDDLKILPLAQLTAEGKVEEGPRLDAVLALAGVTDYSTVHLRGSSNDATLTREQVENDAVLDYTNHGTVKLSTNAIPKAEWTKDVSWIEVK